MEHKGGFHYDVVIAGGGFGGVYAAKSVLKKMRRRPGARVAVVAENNFMVFQPMLPEVCGSSIQSNHVVSPIRRLCRGADVLRGAIHHIDLESRCVCIDGGDFTRNLEIGFDHLVLALGNIVDLSRVPGMPEHAYLMKNAGDALQLRASIIDRLEEANLMMDPGQARKLLTFVVVGGGYSGVETAGQILDLLRAVHRFYQRVDSASFRVVLVHSGKFLLPEINEKLGRYCQEILRKRGMEVILEDRVSAMTGTKAYLQSGRVIETYNVVSTVGNAPHPLVGRLVDECQLPSVKGRVKTDQFLRVAGCENIWAVGDCAAVPAVEEGICPPTAQFAVRQGTLAGQNIARAMMGVPLKEFAFKGYGSVASIGHRKAVAEMFGFTFSGFFAWILWRTIYLLKLPSLDRKLRVLIDWNLDLLFPRDISLLRPGGTRVYQEMHFEKSDWIFHAGERAESFYIIKSGAINLQEDGRLVKSLGPGEHFGERALLEDGIWRFDAVAAEHSILVAVNSEFFRTFSTASESIRQLMERTSLQYLPEQRIHLLARQIPPSIQQMPIGQLMSKEVVSMRPQMTVREALQVLKTKCYNSFPLVDEEGVPAGMIEQDDLLEAVKRSASNLNAPVSRFQARAAPCLSSDQPASEAIKAMIRTGTRKLLVVDKDRKLIGLLSLLDLFSSSDFGEMASNSKKDQAPVSFEDYPVYRK
jgi:NADH:ubiquinone reductase (H+-translocating)